MCILRYGKKAAFLTDENDEKKRKALIEKFGTLYPFKLKKILNLAMKNSIITMKEKYGVEYGLQNEDLFKRAISAIGKMHTYTFKCGSELIVQGYERFMLRELEMHGHGYDMIKVGWKEMPDIRYTYRNKEHRYYPDIMVKRKLIEVKSNWSYLLNPDKNIAKWDATVNRGHTLLVAFYDASHRRVKLFKWVQGTIINILPHPIRKSSYKIELV